MSSIYIIYGGIILVALILGGPTLLEDARRERNRRSRNK